MYFRVLGNSSGDPLQKWPRPSAVLRRNFNVAKINTGLRKLIKPLIDLFEAKEAYLILVREAHLACSAQASVFLP